MTTTTMRKKMLRKMQVAEDDSINPRCIATIPIKQSGRSSNALYHKMRILSQNVRPGKSVCLSLKLNQPEFVHIVTRLPAPLSMFVLESSGPWKASCLALRLPSPRPIPLVRRPVL
jgi:hypothetical protein